MPRLSAAQSTARATSVDFTRTVTALPSLSPRSATDSAVIDDVIVWPPSRRTFTTAMAAPSVTDTTVPVNWLRIDSFTVGSLSLDWSAASLGLGCPACHRSPAAARVCVPGLECATAHADRRRSADCQGHLGGLDEHFHDAASVRPPNLVGVSPVAPKWPGSREVWRHPAGSFSRGSGALGQP